MTHTPTGDPVHRICLRLLVRLVRDFRFLICRRDLFLVCRCLQPWISAVAGSVVVDLEKGVVDLEKAVLGLEKAVEVEVAVGLVAVAYEFVT